MEIYCFVDAAHLREMAKAAEKPLANPRELAVRISYSQLVQSWQSPENLSPMPHHFKQRVPETDVRFGLSRVIFYDGVPDEGADEDTLAYWEAIEHLHDTETGFGAARGKPRRQKRVDSLIAVDMLSGAFDGLYKIAILVAADADFVPVVDAVRRRGAMVVVAAQEPSQNRQGSVLSPELRKVADRFFPLTTDEDYFPPLVHSDLKRRWYVDGNKVTLRTPHTSPPATEPGG